MKKTKKMTVSEIARISGVSRPVVTAVLSGAPYKSVRYSQETYDKVMRVVEQTGYLPNRAARNLQKNSHNSLGILVSDLWQVEPETFEAISHAAREAGQSVQLEMMSEDTKELPSFMKEDSVDGIIFFAGVHYQFFRQEANRLGIPSIFIHTFNRQVSGIDFDEAGAMKEMVGYCSQQKRKQVALINDYHGTLFSYKRKDLLKKNVRAAGLHDPLFLTLTTEPDSDEHRDIMYREMRDFLQQHEEVDAIIITPDMALSVFTQVCHELNLKIPRDLMIIYMGYEKYAVTAGVPVCSLRIDRDLLGQKAVMKLNERIKKADYSHVKDIMGYEFVIRE